VFPGAVYTVPDSPRKRANHGRRLGDGPPQALEVQAYAGPLIQAFTDETSLRVRRKGNRSLIHIIQ